MPEKAWNQNIRKLKVLVLNISCKYFLIFPFLWFRIESPYWWFNSNNLIIIQFVKSYNHSICHNCPKNFSSFIIVVYSSGVHKMKNLFLPNRAESCWFVPNHAESCRFVPNVHKMKMYYHKMYYHKITNDNQNTILSQKKDDNRFYRLIQTF